MSSDSSGSCYLCKLSYLNCVLMSRSFRNLMHVGPQMSSFLLCKVWHLKCICTSIGDNQNYCISELRFSSQWLMKYFHIAVY